MDLIQCVICPPAEQWDEIKFQARVFLAAQIGEPAESPELAEAADRLRERQVERMLQWRRNAERRVCCAQR